LKNSGFDKQTSVVAVVPVFNRCETTLQALSSLARIDLKGIDLQVIIVDDGSTDGTSEAIGRAFPGVTVVRGDGSLHYAGGTNLGIERGRELQPDYFLLMNDDSIFHESFLQRLVATAERNSRSVVGALLLLWNEPHRVFQVGQRWDTLQGGWAIPDDLTAFNVPRDAFEVECVVGNCVLVPREAVDECGLMDAEKFPHGWGDAQYFMRLRKAGWRLFVEPRAYVWCEPNTYPPPLHTTSVSKIIDVLFRDRRHPSNLHRQFVARWESAPSRLSAVLAFAVYSLILIGKSLKYAIVSRGSKLGPAESN
jgi:GT2 family glycosyltransferase